MKRLDLSMLGLQVHVKHVVDEKQVVTTGVLSAVSEGDGSRPIMVLRIRDHLTAITADTVDSVRLT